MKLDNFHFEFTKGILVKTFRAIQNSNDPLGWNSIADQLNYKDMGGKWNSTLSTCWSSNNTKHLE